MPFPRFTNIPDKTIFWDSKSLHHLDVRDDQAK